MNVSSDRDIHCLKCARIRVRENPYSRIFYAVISMTFEKIAITPTIIHDDANNSHSHFEEKIFQANDHLQEVSHECPDIDSTFDFINKSTASNITKESLIEIITDLVNKNFIINKKSNGRNSFR